MAGAWPEWALASPHDTSVSARRCRGTHRRESGCNNAIEADPPSDRALSGWRLVANLPLSDLAFATGIATLGRIGACQRFCDTRIG